MYHDCYSMKQKSRQKRPVHCDTALSRPFKDKPLPKKGHALKKDILFIFSPSFHFFIISLQEIL